MPQYANSNWYNAHNFYGDLKDIEAASLPDVQQFFKTYYAPNNAALVVVGDFEPADARKMIDKYFTNIAASQKVKEPDLSEPRQEKEKKASKADPQAKRPALAVAYHMPNRNTPEYYAMGLLDQILLQGDDSLLHAELVQKKGMTGDVSGGINLLGNMYDYNGPMLWMAYLFHDSNVKDDDILAAMDSVIDPLRNKPIDQKTLDRALVKLRSDFYDQLSQFNGFGLADMLASFALFDDNPARVNDVESQFRKMTPALLQKTAQEYLRPTNRTVLTIEPGAATPSAQAGKSGN
jgi:predicted Zn-dependent peptidase